MDLVQHVLGQLPPGEVTFRTEAHEAPTVGDPVLLERLAQNLVERSPVQPAGTGLVCVPTRTGPDGEAVLEVSDTGPAAPRYEIPRLFEPFRRGSGARVRGDRVGGEAPGAGLGLSIVQAVARADGGDVCADPRPEGRLTVTVTLPGDPAGPRCRS